MEDLIAGLSIRAVRIFIGVLIVATAATIMTANKIRKNHKNHKLDKWAVKNAGSTMSIEHNKVAPRVKYAKHNYKKVNKTEKAFKDVTKSAMTPMESVTYAISKSKEMKLERVSKALQLYTNNEKINNKFKGSVKDGMFEKSESNFSKYEDITCVFKKGKERKKQVMAVLYGYADETEKFLKENITTADNAFGVVYNAEANSANIIELSKKQETTKTEEQDKNL